MIAAKSKALRTTNYDLIPVKEQSMVAKSTKILSSKECKALLEDVRRSYDGFCRHFLELGEKFEAIRDQEAYGESCATFDQWIKSEGYGHSIVYGSMKAARLYRLMEPTLKPRKISLDCESHYRDIPADVTPKEAKAIAGKIVELVDGASDAAKLTRQQVKAAVDAVRKKVPAPRPDVPESIEAEIAAIRPNDETITPPSETRGPVGEAAAVSGKYADVESLIDGSDPNYWNGQPCIYARELRAVNSMVRATWSQHAECAEFRDRLASLLSSLALEIRGLERETFYANARRAK
jgi:hypothetical protein